MKDQKQALKAQTRSLKSTRPTNGAYTMINSSSPPIAVGMPPINFTSFKCLHAPTKSMSALRDNNWATQPPCRRFEARTLDSTKVLQCCESNILKCLQIYHRMHSAADNTLPPRTVRIRILVQTPVVQDSRSSLPGPKQPLSCSHCSPTTTRHHLIRYSNRSLQIPLRSIQKERRPETTSN